MTNCSELLFKEQLKRYENVSQRELEQKDNFITQAQCFRGHRMSEELHPFQLEGLRQE